MSDRRAILFTLGLLASATRPLAAQASDRWVQELVRAEREFTSATVAVSQYRERRAFGTDATLRAGGRTVRYRTEEVTAADSAAVAQGLELGLTQLRERFGDAAAALADTSALGITVDRRRFSRSFRLYVIRSPNFTQTYLETPVDPARVAGFVRQQAGENLIARTPALKDYAGYTIFTQFPDQADAEIVRRLATSWAAAGRRCISGGATSCAALADPVTRNSSVERYFEPRDYRDVVASAKLPAVADSAFMTARRKCLDGSDSVCAALVPIVNMVDPFGPFVRGSLLSHAIRLGGPTAVGRILASSGSAPLPVLAEAAGVSETELVMSWRAQLASSVVTGPASLRMPLLGALLWSAVLLGASLKRRYL